MILENAPLLDFARPTPMAILGTGRVGQNLAQKLAERGHPVLMGSRDPEACAERWNAPGIVFLDPAAAIRQAELVINALPGEHSLEVLRGLQSELAGKILVDVANAVQRSAGQMEPLYPDSSLGERLQEALPETEVVKTLNTMMFKVMTDPHALQTPPTAFLSGDSSRARATVQALLKELGWPADWTLDLGDISSARGTEALFLLVPHLVRSLGFVPFALGIAR
ncbi:NADPH-dependent F420 reductase [Deinococcus roseus]|uniref:Oxidoreductase n=1 Tax=Deinococcus roseus TaxID=392414 RepID=A0ABQ2CZN8_9DEIO|nr:NAD(P)-binding domain-containing protein [Deinococcus roseus]GGJ36543.1 oxidoreductase [Deinococcus roseus]